MTAEMHLRFWQKADTPIGGVNLGPRTIKFESNNRSFGVTSGLMSAHHP